MKKGKLFGVGIGPGDKELITIKAVNIIKNADVIALPDSFSSKNRAYEIVKEYITGKEIIYLPMPMTKDKEHLRQSHENGAELIINCLDKGKNVAFATLGDPSVYSTYMYVHRIVESKGYSVEIVPGVTSFCASAARLNISLCDGADPLIIIPANYKDNKELLQLSGNKVLMKSGRKMAKVKQEIAECGLTDKTYMVENCGMKEEKIYKDFSMAADESSYFSLIIVKG
ncbi:MAG: precorrin-2 C(20)-methyltransferase [Mucispirillum sp.]|nr:precorrin-2 C(20)-methyltransferase [Mucispirillum sp.]